MFNLAKLLSVLEEPGQGHLAELLFLVNCSLLLLFVFVCLFAVFACACYTLPGQAMQCVFVMFVRLPFVYMFLLSVTWPSSSVCFGVSVLLFVYHRRSQVKGAWPRSICSGCYSSGPKIEDGGFFDLRGRRSKIEDGGGSSIFGSEDRRQASTFVCCLFILYIYQYKPVSET